MTHKKVQIEELLERVGEEMHEDTVHRYELRRALLRSKHFESSRQKSRWDFVFSYSAPLVAGTVVVGVFALMATTLVPTEQAVPQSSSSGMNVVLEAIPAPGVASVDVGTAPASDFMSDPEAPLVQLADFAKVAQEQIVRFVPVSPHGVILVR